jgi:recombination protein RecR
MLYAPPITRLIEAFQRLPGVGPKTAQRLALHILKQPENTAQQFSQALIEAKQQIVACSQCYAWTDHDPCAICASPNRNTTQICVVAEYSDLSALERTNEYRGLYHVLNGLISPLAGVGPEDLTIRALLDRLQASRPSGGDAVTASPSLLGNSINPMALPSSHHLVHEVILALPPSVEGDTTSLYLSRQLQAMGIQITRIGFGLPVGGDLEYADTLTITRALQARQAV